MEKAKGFCTPKEGIDSGENKAAAIAVNKIDALLDKFSDRSSVSFHLSNFLMQMEKHQGNII